jgi:hypothetical protein
LPSLRNLRALRVLCFGFRVGTATRNETMKGTARRLELLWDLESLAFGIF